MKKNLKSIIGVAHGLLLAAALVVPSLQAALLTPLVTDTGEEVGILGVAWEDGNIVVFYEAYPGWEFASASSAVEPSNLLIPRDSQGNPRVSQFRNQFVGGNGVTSFFAEVPYDTEQNPEAAVAAYAVVQRRNRKGKVIQTATAWGKGSKLCSVFDDGDDDDDSDDDDDDDSGNAKCGHDGDGDDDDDSDDDDDDDSATGSGSCCGMYVIANQSNAGEVD